MVLKIIFSKASENNANSEVFENIKTISFFSMEMLSLFFFIGLQHTQCIFVRS